MNEKRKRASETVHFAIEMVHVRKYQSCQANENGRSSFNFYVECACACAICL